MREATQNLTLTVTVDGFRRWSLRTRIALILFRLGGLISPVPTMISTVEQRPIEVGLDPAKRFSAEHVRGLIEQINRESMAGPRLKVHFRPDPEDDPA